MKKIMLFLISLALTLTIFTGCENKAKQASLDAIADSYASNSYYDEEQKEIDAIVSDYTSKIEEAKSDEDIKKLEEEAIEKIGSVYTKEKIDGIRADAEEALKMVKGKILPYQQVRELLPKVKELIGTNQYAELEAAANDLKTLMAGVSEKASFECSNDGVPFSFEVEYTEENGLPKLTYHFSDDVKKCGVKQSNHQILSVSMATICHSSILNPTVDKMASYTIFGFNDEMIVYCGEESDRMYENAPQLARCQINGNDYQFTVFTEEQKATLESDSDEFTNSDGVVTKRDSGDEDPVNYIAVLVSYPSKPKGSTYADRLTWVIVI
jgi:hypothetical protein